MQDKTTKTVERELAEYLVARMSIDELRRFCIVTIENEYIEDNALFINDLKKNPEVLN